MQSAIKGAATMAAAGVAFLASAGLAAAGDVRTVGPTRGVVLDVGSKHTVSYFTADGGRCNLTLMVSEKADEPGDTPSVGARIRVAIDSGKAALIETAEGKSLEFTCAQGAEAMSVRALDVIAYHRNRN